MNRIKKKEESTNCLLVSELNGNGLVGVYWMYRNGNQWICVVLWWRIWKWKWIGLFGVYWKEIDWICCIDDSLFELVSSHWTEWIGCKMEVCEMNPLNQFTSLGVYVPAVDFFGSIDRSNSSWISAPANYLLWTPPLSPSDLIQYGTSGCQLRRRGYVSRDDDSLYDSTHSSSKGYCIAVCFVTTIAEKCDCPRYICRDGWGWIKSRLVQMKSLLI